MSQRHDYLVKIVLIGDSGVGKSSFVLKYCDNSFKVNVMTTIGVDFKIKRLTIDGKVVKLQIWDTAGQEKYRTITSGYYRGAHGIILLFDVSDRSSYENVRKWMMQIDEHASPSTTKILIGNKADCEEASRKVSTAEGEALAKSYNIKYFEASAKAGLNISESLENIIRQVILNLKANPTFYAMDVVKLDDRTDNNTNSNRNVSTNANTNNGGKGCC